ncbi:MAG: metal-dependent transcriptional regulator [Conexivisphaerales archaeon]
MELLQKLTRRQVEVLLTIKGLPLKKKGVQLEDIASALGVSPPTALEHVKALQYLGLVRRVAGKTRVTSRGEACINEYWRHHRVAESLFFTLHFPADRACEAAKMVDLALSHEIIDRLCSVQGHPRACPHGQPIPPCSEEMNR